MDQQKIERVEGETTEKFETRLTAEAGMVCECKTCCSPCPPIRPDPERLGIEVICGAFEPRGARRPKPSSRGVSGFFFSGDSSLRKTSSHRREDNGPIREKAFPTSSREANHRPIRPHPALGERGPPRATSRETGVRALRSEAVRSPFMERRQWIR
jgi:hypothetical protein